MIDFRLKSPAIFFVVGMAVLKRRMSLGTRAQVGSVGSIDLNILIRFEADLAPQTLQIMCSMSAVIRSLVRTYVEFSEVGTVAAFVVINIYSPDRSCPRPCPPLAGGFRIFGVTETAAELGLACNSCLLRLIVGGVGAGYEA